MIICNFIKTELKMHLVFALFIMWSLTIYVYSQPVYNKSKPAKDIANKNFDLT